MILDPQHALRIEERAELEKLGVIIQRPLTNGRLLVRIAADSSFDSDDPRVRSLLALTLDQKIHRSARREAAKLRAFAQLDVLFHDDVSFDAAKHAIESYGGAIDQPLALDFEMPRMLAGRVPATELEALASDERVLMVRGPWRIPMRVDNAFSARLSHVTELQAAQYGLTGQGVAISMFELAAADISHPEFGGRFSLMNLNPCAPNCASSARHPTHVAGTMIAAGTGDARAKGMAPGATLTEFSTYPNLPTSVERYLSDKENKLSPLGVVADNNSWGYILGWERASPWIWNDTEEYYGAYDGFVTAPIDRITRKANVLFVHSAGNDAMTTGPSSAPFAHHHVDDDGVEITDKTYCYSTDGSGGDCPVPTCSAGRELCEIARHSFTTFCGTTPNCPWNSIGLTASAKNSIAVGATDSLKIIADYSSRGPTRDGRVKPDLTVRGGLGIPSELVFSTFPNNTYGGNDGTSMAAPVVTGIAALFVEQYRRTFGGATPTPDIIKTTLIAGAEDRGNPGPDYTYGFGFVDAKAAIDLVIADGSTASRIKVATMEQGGTFETPLTVLSTQKLRVVAGWSDPEVLYLDEKDIGNPALVNDLDLKVIDPNGNSVRSYVLDRNQPEKVATRAANAVDTTEEVEIANAAPGVYRVIVSGTRITAEPPQRFVLVANAPFGIVTPPCVDVREPNDTTATAYGYLVESEDVNAKLCSPTDVDIYKFKVNAPGEIRIVITTTDTPLRVTLSSGATTPVSLDVPASSGQTLTTTYGGSTAVDFFLEVKAVNATIGTGASYVVRPIYPFHAGARRRTTRH